MVPGKVYMYYMYMYIVWIFCQAHRQPLDSPKWKTVAGLLVPMLCLVLVLYSLQCGT